MFDSEKKSANKMLDQKSMSRQIPRIEGQATDSPNLDSNINKIFALS